MDKSLIVITICYEANGDLLKTLQSISFHISERIKSYVFIKNYVQGETEKFITSQFFCILNDTGLYNALNIVHKNIKKDDYVFYLHCGDILDPNFDLGCEISQISQYDISVYKVKMTNSKGNFIRTFPSVKSIFHPYVYLFSHTGIIFKNKIYFDVGGYNEKYSISSDFDFIIKLFKYCAPKSCRYSSKNISIMTFGGLSTNSLNLYKIFHEDYSVISPYTNFPLFFLFLKKTLRLICTTNFKNLLCSLSKKIFINH
jgi:hypothetical protein